MENNTNFEVIIIGGSYSGLSAAMALGRSMRKTLIIDSGKPCNQQTPYSHNFITQDSKKPLEIASVAKEQVLKYPTVQFYDGLAVKGRKTSDGFEIETENDNRFTAKKLIFASGIKDEMPKIKGFADCWGISILHCPYCHGYEIHDEKTGILLNGDFAFEFGKLIYNWTKDLIIFTNGKSTLTTDQTEQFRKHDIEIIETKIEELIHQNGQIEHVVFTDGSTTPLTALYAKIPFTQNCKIPEMLDCNLTDHGYLEIEAFQKTNVHGVYACGDNTTFMRSISNAVAMGTLAGATLNKELIDEEF